MRLIRTLGLAAIAAAALVTAMPGDAFAGDRHRRHHHGGWGHPGRGWGPPPRPVYVAPRYYAPRAYYAPPPRVYYAPPPPVYYAPPPAYYGPPGVSLNFRF